MSVEINQIFFHRLQPIDENATYSASIRITSDGLSVFVKNGMQPVAAAAYQWANNCTMPYLEQLLLQIKNSAPLNEGRIGNVTVFVDEDAYTLVPESLFVESAAMEYLKYHVAEEVMDQGVILNAQVGEVMGLFLVSKIHLEVVKTVFGGASIESYNWGLLKLSELFSAKSSAMIGCVSISGDHFDLLVKKRGQLQFFNRFAFSSKEDFIYFLMMALQQLQVNPVDIELNVLGKIEVNSSLFELMCRYFPSVNVVNDIATYPWDFHRYCVEQKI